MFTLASSVCKSLQCLISALTQGGEGGHLFRLTCSVVLWGGRNTANKYCWHMWGVLCSVRTALGLPQLTVGVLSWSTLLRLQVALQGVGPGLRALPRSKPLRFRFLGSPRRHRLSWACVLCPSQVQEAQATRCLVSALSSGGECVLSPPWSQPLGFLGGSGAPISSVPCVSSGKLSSGCDPPRCQQSGIPGSLG